MLVRCLHEVPTGSLDTLYTPNLSSTSSSPNLFLSLALSLLIMGLPSVPGRPASAAKRCLWYLPLSHCPACPVGLCIHFFLFPLPLACFRLLLPFPGDSLRTTICGLSLLQFISHVASRFLQHNSILLKYFDTTVEPRAVSFSLCDSVFHLHPGDNNSNGELLRELKWGNSCIALST